jgi:PAS domain S-box-containing protein
MTGPDRRLLGRVRPFYMAVENNPGAIMVTDGEGKIKYINPRFTEMTGYSVEEVLDRTPRILRSGYHDPPFYEDLWRTILSGRIWSGEFRNRRKDGSLYWESASVAPVKNRDGIITYFVAIKQDVTDQKRNREELLRAKERAEAANEAKSAFLATMNHEIRTPMNGIIGMTELLITTDLSGEQREYLEIVRTSAHALLHILNEMLDFSKIQAGKMEIDSVPLEIASLVEGAVDMFTLRAREKGIDLACQIDPFVPASLLGDPNRLRQVLFNLLDNAVKYTERGSVAIRVESRPEQGGSVNLSFSVIDTGIGISEDSKERLFHSFEQIDGFMTRKQGGTGLGLVIARSLVELMGGSLTFESRLGRGSTFRACLPFRVPVLPVEVPTVSSSPAQPSVPPPDLPSSLKILMAEDHPISRRLVATLVEKRGWHLDAASDGKQAVSLYEASLGRDEGYDLVLMDVQMPEMDGMDATRAIRRIEEERGLSRIPIVALTAYALPGDYERCLAVGMDDYLGKPIRVSEFFRVIDRMTRGERRDGKE